MIKFVLLFLCVFLAAASNVKKETETTRFGIRRILKLKSSVDEGMDDVLSSRRNLGSNCRGKMRGEQCVFPFNYQGITYNSCTEENHDQLWCATSLNSNGGYATWDNCSEDCQHPEHCRGRMRGQQCVFPFNYQGRTYTACTKKNHDQLWCATSLNSNGGYATWDNCSEDCPSDCRGKMRGEQCVFPFKYLGQTYNGCTKKRHDQLWCATSLNSNGYYATWDNCAEDCPSEN